MSYASVNPLLNLSDKYGKNMIKSDNVTIYELSKLFEDVTDSDNVSVLKNHSLPSKKLKWRMVRQTWIEFFSKSAKEIIRDLMFASSNSLKWTHKQKNMGEGNENMVLNTLIFLTGLEIEKIYFSNDIFLSFFGKQRL